MTCQTYNDIISDINKKLNDIIDLAPRFNEELIYLYNQHSIDADPRITAKSLYDDDLLYKKGVSGCTSIFAFNVDKSLYDADEKFLTLNVVFDNTEDKPFFDVYLQEIFHDENISLKKHHMNPFMTHYTYGIIQNLIHKIHNFENEYFKRVKASQVLDIFENGE